MDQHAFEEYLEKQPKVSGTEIVGRIVKNAFDMDEKVVLPATYWRYIDWVAEDQGEDMEAWIKNCDLNRNDKTLSENLMEWLYWDMMDRREKDHPLPDWLEFI
jgi:hypothetical protein